MSEAPCNKTPVSVLHVGKYFPPHVGGMETYLRDLMEASTTLGVRSAALVHQSQLGLHSSEEHISAGGAEIRVTRAATWARLLFTPLSPVFPWRLHRLIKTERPDILHLHLPNPSAFWALLLPSARRLPWVVHWQSDVLTPESSGFLKIAYRLYRPFESALLKRARRIIATSLPYLETSKALAPVMAQCEVIPLGTKDPFTSQRAAATPEGTRIGPSSPAAAPLKVLAIGRLTYYKGFDVLLRAVAQTSDITLDIVGTGDETAALDRLAHSLCLTSRVRFHGALDEEQKNRLLSSCDCLCLPSTDRAESFGVVLLEAMSAAKACVVSDVAGSGMSWLVDHERTGLVTPTRDAAALATALCQLRDDRNLAIAFGQAGRRKFETSFTIGASASAIQSLYTTLVEPDQQASLDHR
jgi:glycosyltransferase involved in cell wall biosynthesis